MRRWALGLTMAVVAAGSSVPQAQLAQAQDGAGCRDATARLTEDYRHVVGTATYVPGDAGPRFGGAFRWLANDGAIAEGPLPELLDVPFDDDVAGTGGDVPTVAEGVGFVGGRWGRALRLTDGGKLAYRRAGNLDLEEGTIEMWVALRSAGTDPVYAARSHVLLQYRAPNGDWLGIAQAESSGVVYAGGTVSGQWQSAYGARGQMRDWHAGEWHHVGFTFSAIGNYMRFYVDGVLAADTNEKRYRPPSAAGEELYLAGDRQGNAAAYDLDAVRILDRPAGPEEIAAWSARTFAPGPSESWLATSLLTEGDVVRYEVTPADGASSGTPCRSEAVVYPGIPLFDPRPPSTLLPPNTTELQATVRSAGATTVAFSVGEPLPYEAMTPCAAGDEPDRHVCALRGLDPSPNVVNRAFMRSAAQPDFLMALRYRALSEVSPRFPRTGNLWGSWAIGAKGMRYASRIDLWLGASFTSAQIQELRRLNPDVRVLTSINAIEHAGLPDEYYLKDIHGQRVEVWPGSFRLNLTKSIVAEHQARLAYERVLDSDMMYDGCFIDNVMTTQSWLGRDIFGNPFLVDADEDGRVDDPAEFDAAWKSGVFDEIRRIRELLPHAVLSGHSMNVWEPGIAESFSGIGIGFHTADVIEGKRSFQSLLEAYQAWHRLPPRPEATLVESAPPDQLAYGYGYAPYRDAPAATVEFGRTYYPYMRFGLGLTLLDDGYFAHEWGDTWHGNDWWYDELEHDLGEALGPAERVEAVVDPGANCVDNGGFEEPLAGTWRLWANANAGCAAAARLDTANPAAGLVSVRIDTTTTSGTDWHVDFAQFGRALTAGRNYELAFRARASNTRTITLATQKGSPDWRNYGLSSRVTVGTEWDEYRVPFSATETATDSRLQFMVGAVTGTVWLDDVRLQARGPDTYRREFTNGLVLLNGSREPWTYDVGSGYARLQGTQAPLVDAIVDDGTPPFATTGDAVPASFDSGEWLAGGPYFHDWGAGCQLLGPGAEATWTLPISRTDGYTVTAWWPAAPDAAGWSGAARYEIVAGEMAVASRELDQRSGGDEWHLVGEARLAPGDRPYVRLVCAGSAPCVADAVHVRSGARYNDGTAARTVRIAPMDAIVLRRVRYEVHLPILHLPRR